jgi:hypothetical protein
LIVGAPPANRSLPSPTQVIARSRSRIRRFPLTVVASSPDEFGKFLANEVERWARVVRDNKINAGE